MWITLWFGSYIVLNKLEITNISFIINLYIFTVLQLYRGYMSDVIVP